MKFRSEIALYDYQKIASKFTAHDTQFNVVQGKINAICSEEQITTLINGDKTLYSKLSDVEITVDGIRTQVSDVETQVFGDQVNSVKSRLSKVEQTTEGITTTVANVVTTPATVSSIVSKINQGADRISLSVVENGANLATNSYVNTVTGKKAQVIRSTTAPANNTENALKDGDVWVDTDDNNRVHVWNGTGKKWEPSDKKLDELVAWKNSAQIDLTKDSIYQTITSWNNGGQEIVSMINLDKSGAKINGDKIKIVANDSISLAISNGSIKPYYQASAPSSPKQGDIWYNTSSSNYKIYTYNNGSWVETEKDKVPKSGVIASINASSEGVTISGKKVNIDANDSFTVTVRKADKALSKSKVFRSSTQPSQYVTNGMRNINVGDIWYDTTSNKNKMYICSAATDSSATWTADNIVNRINMSSEGIMIDGSKINIAANASFTITAGNASTALSTANTANTLAGKKNTVFRQDSKPTANKTGDVWVDTSNKGNIKVWNGSSWIAETPIAKINASSEGVTIDASKVDITAESFRVQSTKLSWKCDSSSMTKEGKLTCTGADIAGKITATSGSIGGWDITTSKISTSVVNGSLSYTTKIIKAGSSISGRVFEIEKNSNGTITRPFYVQANGFLHCESGGIAGWTINESSIYTKTGNWTTSLNKATGTGTNVIKITDGSSTPFRVTAAGKLIATNAEISGYVAAIQGKFGPYMINDFGFYSQTASGAYHAIHMYRPKAKSSSNCWFQATVSSNSIFSITNAGEVYCAGHLRTAGNKKTRVVKGSDGKYREFYTFESTTPYFMDCGVATTSTVAQSPYSGKGYVQINLNQYFLEATTRASGETPYFVFVQSVMGEADFYVTKLQESFRVVGTPNSKFFWFAFIAQNGIANEYMSEFVPPAPEQEG